MSSHKKSKIDPERRTFNSEWTTKYFFVGVSHKAVCLICPENTAVFNEFNIKRHFQTKHQGFGSNFSDDELLTKAKQL